MKELMVLVERAVRPVRADGRRKMKMRQELLAHLTAAHEQERARLGDDRAALEEASRRFGDPKELTRSLQASVPWWERILFSPVPGSKWLEPLERRAARGAPVSVAKRTGLWAAGLSLTGLLIGGAGVSIYLTWGRPPGLHLAWEWLALTTAMTVVFGAACHAACQAVSGALRPAALVRAAAYAVLAAFPFTAVLAGYMCWRLEIPLDYASLALSAGFAFLGVLGAALLARRQAEIRRQREEWTNLEIGD